MKYREMIEALIVIACGVILLSPVFNTIFPVPFLSLMKDIPDDIISHLAIGLVPIIIVYFIDMVRKKTD